MGTTDRPLEMGKIVVENWCYFRVIDVKDLLINGYYLVQTSFGMVPAIFHLSCK